MITTLKEVDPQIVDDKEIEVVSNNIRNPRLHRCLEQMSKLCLYVLKCDSNNTNGTVKPSDSAKIRAAWDVVKDEVKFNTQEENNDLPGSDYEFAYMIYTPDQKEIRRINNTKTQNVVAEICTCIEHCLSVDSARTQGYTKPEDVATIQQRLDFVDRVMDRWIGKGTSMTDTGLSMPSYPGLGKIQPDIDGDWATKLEHSKELPMPQHTPVKS